SPCGDWRPDPLSPAAVLAVAAHQVVRVPPAALALADRLQLLLGVGRADGSAAATSTDDRERCEERDVEGLSAQAARGIRISRAQGRPAYTSNEPTERRWLGRGDASRTSKYARFHAGTMPGSGLTARSTTWPDASSASTSSTTL